MASPFRNQIVGLIRFSYPATDGFRLTEPDPVARIVRLYAPERLEFRFRLLEHLTLPSLRAQTDQDFGLSVLVGADLPDAAKDRLTLALTGFARARVVALPPLAHMKAAHLGITAVSDPLISHVTGFRLDDDDAVDTGFIARLRARAQILAPMNGLSRPLVIGGNRGLVLRLGPRGNTLTEVTEKLPIGIGLAMTAPYAFRGGIFRRNHRLLPQFFSTFTDVETPAFIRTIHSGNDSQPQTTGQSIPLSQAGVDAILAAHFPFSAADLMAL